MSYRRALKQALLVIAILEGGIGSAQGKSRLQPPFLGVEQQQSPSVAVVALRVLDANLTLTSTQKERIQKIQERLVELRDDLRPEAQAGPPDIEAIRANFEKLRSRERQAAREVESFLTPAQRQALPDLLKDVALFSDAGLPGELIRMLNLTADQKQQIGDIISRARQLATVRLQEAQEEGDREKIRSILSATRHDIHDGAIAVLTDAQQQQVNQFSAEHPVQESPRPQMPIDPADQPI